MRKFETGATRDTDTMKPDYEGFLSPLVIEEYGRYMNRHRVQPDGQLRESDNWQLGIPKEAYIKSCWRHFVDLWKWHRSWVPPDVGLDSKFAKEALCGVIFNASGYLHELLKNERAVGLIEEINEKRRSKSNTSNL